MRLVKKHINILLPLTVVAAICRVVPGMEFFYYPTPILLGLFIVAGYDKVFQNKSLKILILLLVAFGLWAMLTSLWSDYSLVSLSRGAYFLLVALGGVIVATLWRDTKAFKKNPFGFLLPANILIVGSGLISLVVGFPEDAWIGGNNHGFMGFTAHQNTLGALILFTFPAPFYKVLSRISGLTSYCSGVAQKPKRDADLHQHARPQKDGNPDLPCRNVGKFVFYILILLSNVLLLLLSHSRASLLSLAIGIVLTFLLYLSTKQKLYFIGSLGLIVVIIAFTPSLSSQMEKYVFKGTSTITANRDIIWEPSYNAAKLGGLFGLGFGISHSNIILDGTGSYYKNGRYIREKGNSILALIEEVGLVGFILFVLPILYTFKNIFSSSFKRIRSNNLKSNRLKSDILYLKSIVSLSFLIAFILHSQFEAWWVGVSSFALLIFIMFLGSTIRGNGLRAKQDEY